MIFFFHCQFSQQLKASCDTRHSLVISCDVSCCSAELLLKVVGSKEIFETVLKVFTATCLSFKMPKL